MNINNVNMKSCKELILKIIFQTNYDFLRWQSMLKRHGSRASDFEEACSTKPLKILCLLF